jgi:hypothetical protein
MTEELTETFCKEHLQETFQIRLGEARMFDLVLAQVTGLNPAHASPRKEPFSIIFLGPKTPILPQRTYSMTHPTLGTFDIFIVPVGPDKTGYMQYEAVFN